MSANVLLWRVLFDLSRRRSESLPGSLGLRRKLVAAFDEREKKAFIDPIHDVTASSCKAKRLLTHVRGRC
jgi:hypothetical protein